MKRPILSILFLSLCSFVFSQTATDALRYSLQGVQGTARYIGVGGAMGALGTDYSTVSSNPAGLAAYRKSEFVVTPGFVSHKSLARLDENDNGLFEDTSNKLKLNNVGVVFFSRIKKHVRWKSLNLGIGYNKIADYNRNITYEGFTTGSMADSYAEVANGIPPGQLNEFGTSLAYQTGAIYDFVGDNNYMTDFTGFPDTPVFRQENVETTGGINEMVFSLASNYNNRILFGATIGVPFLNWEQNRDYSETDSAADDIPFFNDLVYSEDISTSGLGINFKLGLIYRINQMVRLGAAVHSPTAFSLTDQFQVNLTYSFTEPNNEGGIFNESSPEGDFSYRLRTPWRYMASGAVLIKKFGFVSAEIEYADYGTSSFNFSSKVYRF